MHAAKFSVKKATAYPAFMCVCTHMYTCIYILCVYYSKASNLEPSHWGLRRTGMVHRSCCQQAGSLRLQVMYRN